MPGFAINPPNTPITLADGRYVSSEWYRWFAQVQRVVGDDVVAQLQAAPYLTFTPSTVLTGDKVLTQGVGMSFTSTVSTFTVGLAVSGVTAATYGSASQVSQITVDQYGRATTIANVTITPAAIGAVPIGTTVTAGAGLTGGGDLSANRTFDVGAGTGITVGADTVGLDTASTRNTDHASVTITAGAGLTGGGDITATRTLDVGAGTGITVNANDVAITATGVGAGSVGSATAVPVLTYNAQGQLTVATTAAIPTLDSGTYTPTLTNVANLDASTAYACQYLRVGGTVTVSGRVDIDATLAATSTKVGISLPIASNFTSGEQCGGTAVALSIAGQSGAILADSTNDRAQMTCPTADVGNTAMFFSFTYQLL